MTGNILRASIVCALVLVHASFAAAQEKTALRLINVAGEAEITVQPDEVDFKIEVENVDKDLVAAKKANDQGVKKVLALARSYQIEPQNIKTDYINVEPRYIENAESKPREFVGY